MMPSAISARSSATQRMLLGAISAQRSPCFRPRCQKKLPRLRRSSASNSLPVTETILPSRISLQHGRGLLLSRSRVENFFEECHRGQALRCAFRAALQSPGLSGGRYSSQPSTPVRMGNSGIAPRHLLLRNTLPCAPSVADCARRCVPWRREFRPPRGPARASAATILSARSGSSTRISRCSWPRSRIRLRMRSSIVTPAEGTPAGIDVTIA